MGNTMYKIGRTETGVEIFYPKNNVIYNFNETTWEIIKAIKKYKKARAVKEISTLFSISEQEAQEDIQTVLKNLKIINIKLEDISMNVSNEIFQPRRVQFDVTPRCNSNCIYCLSSNKMMDKTELSTKEIKDTITDLSKLGLWVLTISGGEPLLRKDIFEILDHVSGLKIPIRFFTNGMLIDINIAKKLSKYKDIMLIQISLDSSCPEHHDTQRGIKGSFDKTVKGINNLIKCGITPIIASTITPITLNDIEETARFLHDLGINYLRCVPAKICSEKSISHKDEIYMDLKDVKLLGEKIKNLSKKYEDSMKFSISAFMLDYSANPEQTTDMPVCTSGITSLYITSSGVVYPCIALSSPNFSAGNIKKESIANIWKDSNILKKLRKLSVDDFEKCKSCKVKNICKGGCRGNSYDFFKSLTSYDPLYCSYFLN
jgi:radical SAM protein with 4Fe4S-binding SPASM domain